MNDADLPYNHSFEPLELLIARGRRPGDFCGHRALCSKTRESYLRQCSRHAEDEAAMAREPRGSEG
jgi:hypothetical protein